jgi:hypothetical protein
LIGLVRRHGTRHEPCISDRRSRRRSRRRALPARNTEVRGSIPACHAVSSLAVPSPRVRAHPRLGVTPRRLAARRQPHLHQFRQLRVVDLPGRDPSWRACVQPVRMLRFAPECQCDAVRGVRTKAAASTADLTHATMVIALGLILPWVWLIGLDGALRRTR